MSAPVAVVTCPEPHDERLKNGSKKQKATTRKGAHLCALWPTRESWVV